MLTYTVSSNLGNLLNNVFDCKIGTQYPNIIVKVSQIGCYDAKQRLQHTYSTLQSTVYHYDNPHAMAHCSTQRDTRTTSSITDNTGRDVSHKHILQGTSQYAYNPCRANLSPIPITLLLANRFKWQVQEQTIEIDVQQTNRSIRTPDEMLRVIDLFLSLDMSKKAIQVAQQAAKMYPNHERVQRAARVLSPIQGRRIQAVHPQGLKNSRRWLQEQALAYRGQWVAVYDGTLVGVAETLQSLKERVAQIYPLESLLITKVY